MPTSHSLKMLVLLAKHIDFKNLETNSVAKYKKNLYNEMGLLVTHSNCFHMEGK